MTVDKTAFRDAVAFVAAELRGGAEGQRVIVENCDHGSGHWRVCAGRCTRLADHGRAGPRGREGGCRDAHAEAANALRRTSALSLRVPGFGCSGVRVAEVMPLDDCRARAVYTSLRGARRAAWVLAGQLPRKRIRPGLRLAVPNEDAGERCVRVLDLVQAAVGEVGQVGRKPDLRPGIRILEVVAQPTGGRRHPARPPESRPTRRPRAPPRDRPQSILTQELLQSVRSLGPGLSGRTLRHGQQGRARSMSWR